MRPRLCAIVAALALAALLPLAAVAAPDPTGVKIKIKAPHTAIIGQPFTFTVAVTNMTGAAVPISVATHMPEVGYMGGGEIVPIAEAPGLLADGGGCGAFTGCTIYYNSYPHPAYLLAPGTTRLFEYTGTLLPNYGTVPLVYTISVYQVANSNTLDSASVTIPVTAAG